MNPHFTYFLILGASIAGPLALSFDKKVAFFTKWKYLFPPMILPALFYIGWDIFFTSKGVWSFNERYIVGMKFAGLPLEEILFFVLVPYCCVFIYECIRCYFPGLKARPKADLALKSLAVVLFLAGIVFRQRYYTCWTFVFTAIFILCLYFFNGRFSSFDAAPVLVSYLLVLIPFLVVNGLLTMIPVVIYNDAENLGLRVYTIPFEDIFYGFLLYLMVVAGFERRRNTAH